jgi:hypothetical protein
MLQFRGVLAFCRYWVCWRFCVRWRRLLFLSSQRRDMRCEHPLMVREPFAFQETLEHEDAELAVYELEPRNKIEIRVPLLLRRECDGCDGLPVGYFSTSELDFLVPAMKQANQRGEPAIDLRRSSGSRSSLSGTLVWPSNALQYGGLVRLAVQRFSLASQGMQLEG